MNVFRRVMLFKPDRLQWLFGVICLCCVCLAFSGLDHSALWVDEAETGFVARGVLFSGWPIAYDGNQLYPGQSRFYNEQFLWMELPWLQFYITALSFKLLGVENAFSARLPFVLIGLLTVPLVYSIANRFFGVRIARLSVVLLLLSVPYLLHIRQCRYFALLAFGTIWGIWAYQRFTREERYALLHLIGAAVFLFHSHYAYFFAFMGGLGLWILACERPREWKPLLIAIGCVFLCTFPWALYADLFVRRAAYGGWSFWNTLYNLGYYTTGLHMHVVPFLVLPLVGLVTNRACRRPDRFVFVLIPVLLVVYMLLPDISRPMAVIKNIIGSGIFVLTGLWAYLTWTRSSLPLYGGRFLIIFAVGAILGLSIVIPKQAFRYLMGILPLLSILMAVLLVTLWDRSKVLGILCSLCIIGFNMFNVLPFTLLHWFPLNVRQIEPVINTLPPSWLSRLAGQGSEEIRTKLSPSLGLIDQAITEQAAVRSPLFDYLCEIIYPSQGPVEAVVEHLRAYAGSEETLSTDCDGVTLAFHTGLRIRPISIKTSRLNADWVSLRPHHFYATHTGWWIRHFYDEVLTPAYEKVELDAPDLPTLFYHLPDPNMHLFRFEGTQQHPRMVVFRRKN